MNKITKTMLVSGLTNTLLSLIKIIVGFIGNSGALIADGIHSFSDLITDFIAIIGGKLSSKPADDDHPYGHGKIEYLTSMIISLMIIILGISIIVDSFISDINIPTNIVVIVTIFTIITKLLLSTYIINQGKRYKSNILISSGYESRTDVFSSIVVLISALIVNIKIDIFKYSDKVAMVIVGLLIIKTGFSLIKENISNILGEDDKDPEFRKEIETIIMKYKEVLCIDELVLIKYGGYYQLISDIGMNEKMSLKKVHDILEDIEKDLKENTNIKFITIHVNPYKIEK